MTSATDTIVPLRQALGARIDIAPTVASLQAVILASEVRIDQDRRLPQELVDALCAARVFETLRPREGGGLELHPLDYLDLIFELSRLNGTVGWISLFQNGSLPLLPVAVMQELQAASDGRLIFAGSHARVGRAVRADGGYRLSGHWAFASGSPWATYLTAWAQIIGADGEPETDPDSGEPVLIDVIVPREAVDYLDGWETFGLRGSGSGQYTVDDLFVAERFTTQGLMPDEYADRALYSRFWQGSEMSAIYLGCAQGAIDRYLVTANRRPPSGDAVRDGLRQIQLGEAEATVQAARSRVWELTERDYSTVVAPAEAPEEAPEGAGDDWEASRSSPVNTQMPLEFMAPLAEAFQASVHAAREAKRAVNIIFEIAGTDSIRIDSGIERCLRDLYTGAQHAGVAYRNLGLRGEYLMTQDSADGPTITWPASLV
jgi:alkylation response protein AidB-like acyl-CoA dehydrogenase